MTIDPDEGAADFGARLTAFSADAALAAAGYFLTLKLCFPAYSPLLNPHARAWAALWTALFLLYQAFMSCEGRRSAGKALAGIRVVSAEGEPLGLGKAAVRSALYLASSVFNLGFLWALFDPKGRAWHDLAVDSRVVWDPPPSPARATALRLAACACLAALSGAWYWNNVLGPRRRAADHASFSNAGLLEIRLLEKRHFRRHGRYAATLAELSELSGDPKGFLEGTAVLFEDLRITAAGKGYRIDGRATDPLRTPVSFTGP